MMIVKIALFGSVTLLLLIGMTAHSFAHTTVNVGLYDIEAGWGIEPPIVGIRNDIVLKITKPGESEGSYTGITSAFKNLNAKAMFGGVTKKLDISSDPKPGYYFSPIIPTKIGSYFIDLKGKISGTTINIQIPVEDVETTTVLNFPPSDEESANISSLKNAISSIQHDVSKLKSGETFVSSDDGVAYDFAIFGLAIAVAAIILAIIALLKK